MPGCSVLLIMDYVPPPVIEILSSLLADHFSEQQLTCNQTLLFKHERNKHDFILRLSPRVGLVRLHVHIYLKERSSSKENSLRE